MNKLAKALDPTPTFIGILNKLPPTANIGDICIVNNKEYIYALDWREISFSMEIETDVLKIENQTLIIDKY